MLEINEMKVLRKTVAKKTTIKSQHIRESCGIQSINEWVKRRIKEWDDYVT